MPKIPTVLLTNDDGPPDDIESPYVLGLYRHLTEDLRWNVKVVLPSTQMSWIAKAHYVKRTVKGTYFYPKVDGQGEVLSMSRPLQDGELGEWILLDATPASCANIALCNLFPGQIDLVISGPNYGRNISTAFGLSSGTIGAALSASLSTKVPAIAISYAIVLEPTPVTLAEPAHTIAVRIVNHLWLNWGQDGTGIPDEVDLYSVNIPLIDELLAEGGLKIYWTKFWRNSYGRLFKVSRTNSYAETDDKDRADLVYEWGPDFTKLFMPALSEVPVGSDGWAIRQGMISVTPFQACFSEPRASSERDLESRMWRMKL